MIKHYQFFILLIFILTTPDKNLFGQKKNIPTSETIINQFIEKIGGENWLNLNSRKEYAYVEYEEDRNSIIAQNSDDRIKIDFKPGFSIEVHYLSGNLRNIFAIKPQCTWYYSSKSQTVNFLTEPIKFKNSFPRTELMEILNLEPLKKVDIEDTLYRVDFKDTRQLEEKQSLFFGMNSGLLYKRKYTNKNGAVWEYHFSNYRESQGFHEPYLIKLTSNGKDYFNIKVKSILYNIKIDPNVFNPPIPCKDKNDFTHLEVPYNPDIK